MSVALSSELVRQHRVAQARKVRLGLAPGPVVVHLPPPRRIEAVLVYNRAVGPQQPFIPDWPGTLRCRNVYPYPIGPELPNLYLALGRDAYLTNRDRVLMVDMPAAPPRIRDAVLEILRKHDMRWVEAVSHRRNPQCVRCRDEIAWTLVEVHQWTYSRVGKFMAGRDHTTLITAVGRHKARVKADAAEAAAAGGKS
jgi:hypothetical protein